MGRKTTFGTLKMIIQKPIFSCMSTLLMYGKVRSWYIGMEVSQQADSPFCYSWEQGMWISYSWIRNMMTSSENTF